MNRKAIRKRFEDEGQTITEWARARGFKPRTVYGVLSGQLKGKRGTTHRIAVELGLKRRPAVYIDNGKPVEAA